MGIAALNGYAPAIALSAIGLPAGATPLFSATSVTGSSGVILTITASGVPAGTYPFTIQAASGLFTRTSPAVLIVSATNSTALPDPWTSRTIGPTYAGSATTYTNGVFSVSGPGTQLDGAADSFQFAFQPMIGNITLVARSTGVQNPQLQGAYGVMIRESMSVDGAFAAMNLTHASYLWK